MKWEPLSTEGKARFSHKPSSEEVLTCRPDKLMHMRARTQRGNNCFARRYYVAAEKPPHLGRHCCCRRSRRSGLDHSNTGYTFTNNSSPFQFSLNQELVFNCRAVYYRNILMNTKGSTLLTI